MPLIAHNDLPTFHRLLNEGRVVLPPDRAYQQDIRELHIGFLNMMPDAALEATERQFFRLIGESNKIAQFHMHPFTVDTFKRGGAAKEHINRFYESWDQIKEDGLDALIVTGANEETNPYLNEEEFWEPLYDVLEWASENVTSTICSCLASHAAVRKLYGATPAMRETKRWGVFSHRVLDRAHPLCRSMNTVFDAPHSRYSDLSRAQFEQAGLKILVESEEAGVHVAVSPDGFRLICMQAHPEYDIHSLLKEYRREIARYIEGERDDYPPLLERYFNEEVKAVLTRFEQDVTSGAISSLDTFPEKDLEPLLDCTWRDSARAMIGNWVGAIYQVTNVDRKKQFMDGVNPEDPFGWRKD